MIYAKVHDRTVAEDFFEAMNIIENGINRSLDSGSQ
jgi:hypothetical protein